jgi:hypothetical protein
MRIVFLCPLLELIVRSGRVYLNFMMPPAWAHDIRSPTNQLYGSTRVDLTLHFCLC